MGQYAGMPQHQSKITIHREQQAPIGRHSRKVAIVTGGASGIGAATVHRLAAEGARVIIADVDHVKGEQIAAQTGGEFVRVDVAQASDWQSLAGSLDRLDIVFNNAYAASGGPTELVTEQGWNNTLAVTLTPIFHCVKSCIALLKSSGGTIINTASVHALVGFSGAAAYDAAKGGVCALTRSLAVEYGPQVRVNAVLPGAIETPAWDGTSDEMRKAFVQRVPANRLGMPEDIAAVVSFLASSDASYITGASIVVDGGYTIHNEP